MNGTEQSGLISNVSIAFSNKGIEPVAISVRLFPDETIVLVEIEAEDLEGALQLSSSIEDSLPKGVLIIIRIAKEKKQDSHSSVRSVSDTKITELIELLNERSRTSERHPSLHYIKDATENLRIAVTRRHHIIFGRRGVGKTALLVESKRQLESAGALVLWANIQSLRGLSAEAAFLTIVKRICALPRFVHLKRRRLPLSLPHAARLADRTQALLDTNGEAEPSTSKLVPDVQDLINLLCAECGTDLYLFLDDFHYLNVEYQPKFLDLVHGITRDNNAWIKAAGIENQCRVFQSDPPMGMQIGHDAAQISLDITLEEPAKARQFLVSILDTYLKEVKISNRSGFLTGGALDRLVLASGGVPRDFLLLCARSIQMARVREKARQVGTQDVNEAAGEAGKQKNLDLEEDAASSAGKADVRVEAMKIVRNFTLVEQHHTFFRVNFRDKSNFPDEYTLLQSLMDLRLIHLVKGSLSEAHAAGERSEVYMMDLSFYSGYRLMKDISVIDLQGDTLVLRKTGLEPTKIEADTSRKLIQIFRTGPEFKLTLLTPLVESI